MSAAALRRRQRGSRLAQQQSRQAARSRKHAAPAWVVWECRQLHASHLDGCQHALQRHLQLHHCKQLVRPQRGQRASRGQDVAERTRALRGAAARRRRRLPLPAQGVQGGRVLQVHGGCLARLPRCCRRLLVLHPLLLKLHQLLRRQVGLQKQLHQRTERSAERVGGSRRDSRRWSHSRSHGEGGQHGACSDQPDHHPGPAAAHSARLHAPPLTAMGISTSCSGGLPGTQGVPGGGAGHSTLPHISRRSAGRRRANSCNR